MTERDLLNLYKSDSLPETSLRIPMPAGARPPAAGVSGRDGALAIQDSARGPDHPSVADILGNLADVQRQRGDLGGAEASLRRALEIMERTYGPDHPRVGLTLGNLADVQRQRGDLDAAEASLLRALAIEEKTHGPDLLNVR